MNKIPYLYSVKILLDIDGVLIPARPWQTYEMAVDGFGMFSKMAVKQLNQIITSAINPEIVLSTSHKNSFSTNQWQEIFNSRGVIAVSLSRLDTNSLEMTRKDEILKWHFTNPNEKFIILDDDKGLNALDQDFKNDHLILTKASIGLNSAATEEAIKKMCQLEN